MTNGDFANLQEVEDIESHNVHAMMKRLCFPSKLRWKLIRRSSRDNARTPVQWSGGRNAGFTTGEKPWLKLNGNYQTVNVEKEQADDKGVLAFWKRMIRLRKENEILCSGDFTPLLESKRVYAYRRSLEGRSLICICNMTSKTVAFPKNLTGKLLLSSYEKVQACVRVMARQILVNGVVMRSIIVFVAVRSVARRVKRGQRGNVLRYVCL